jgi:hypothetical protein
MSGGFASSGFEIENALDRRAFPTARRNRTGPPPAGTAGPFAQPIGSDIGRVRVFPWRVNEAATSRTTFSTPKLLGNVIISSLFFSSGSHGDPPQDTLEVGYALVPVTETAVALATARPYTLLTELLDPSSGILNTAGFGFPGTTLNTPTRGSRIPLGLIIMERECAVTLSVVNSGAFVQTWIGAITVIENLSLAALARYIPAP